MANVYDEIMVGMFAHRKVMRTQEMKFLELLTIEPSFIKFNDKFSTGLTSLGLTISSPKNLVLLLSNSSTKNNDKKFTNDQDRIGHREDAEERDKILHQQ